jgi:hypothetical protein
MRTDALLVAAVHGRGRRGPALPGLAPILLGLLVLSGWMLLANPFTALPAVFRQGASAGDDALFMALISVAGLMAAGLFAVAVSAYVVAMRSLHRTR